MSHYQKKIIINIGIFLLLFLAIATAVIYPALQEIKKTNREITAEKNQLQQKLYLGLNLKAVKEDLDRIQNSLPEIEKIFIPGGQELTFISSLEDLAAVNGVNINLNPDFTAPADSGAIKKVPLRLNLSGAYPQILKTLKQIEALPYYYNLERLSLEPGPTDKKEIVLQATGQIYFLKK